MYLLFIFINRFVWLNQSLRILFLSIYRNCILIYIYIRFNLLTRGVYVLSLILWSQHSRVVLPLNSMLLREIHSWSHWNLLIKIGNTSSLWLQCLIQYLLMLWINLRILLNYLNFLLVSLNLFWLIYYSISWILLELLMNCMDSRLIYLLIRLNFLCIYLNRDVLFNNIILDGINIWCLLMMNDLITMPLLIYHIICIFNFNYISYLIIINCSSWFYRNTTLNCITRGKIIEPIKSRHLWILILDNCSSITVCLTPCLFNNGIQTMFWKCLSFILLNIWYELRIG